MIKPRNTLVVVKLVNAAERKVGKITVPTNNDSYTEADVIAVGPGTVSNSTTAAAGVAMSETHDLKVGQRVWVKHQKKLSNGHQTKFEPEGLPYVKDGVSYVIFEQSSIVGILAEPGDAPPVDLTQDNDSSDPKPPALFVGPGPLIVQ